jgi:hypothetical protein
MMRYLVCMVVFWVGFSYAGAAMALEVSDAVITTAIVEREPVDSVDVFPVQNGKLYCFTRITGADEPTYVYHLWYREGQLMSRVELAVNTSSWRTWSAKNLLEDWPGKWRVEIQDVAGKVLQTLEFQLHE